MQSWPASILELSSKLLRGGYLGDYIGPIAGVIKGDTAGSLDYSSFDFLSFPIQPSKLLASTRQRELVEDFHALKHYGSGCRILGFRVWGVGFRVMTILFFPSDP